MTDAGQFEAFVRRYQDMVFATAVRLVGNPADAEDIAQTVFLRAFQRFGEIGPSPAAPGWLKTVTRNACLNHLSRYRARWRLFSELGRPDAEDSEATYEAGAHVRRIVHGWMWSRLSCTSIWRKRFAGSPITSAYPSCSFISKT